MRTRLGMHGHIYPFVFRCSLRLCPRELLYVKWYIGPYIPCLVLILIQYRRRALIQWWKICWEGILVCSYQSIILWHLTPNYFLIRWKLSHLIPNDFYIRCGGIFILFSVRPDTQWLLYQVKYVQLIPNAFSVRCDNFYYYWNLTPNGFGIMWKLSHIIPNVFGIMWYLMNNATLFLILCHI